MELLENPTENEQIIGLLTYEGRSAWGINALYILAAQKNSPDMLIQTFISRAAARLLTTLDFGSHYAEYAQTLPTLLAMKGIFPNDCEFFFVKDGLIKPKKESKDEEI